MIGSLFIVGSERLANELQENDKHDNNSRFSFGSICAA